MSADLYILQLNQGATAADVRAFMESEEAETYFRTAEALPIPPRFYNRSISRDELHALIAEPWFLAERGIASREAYLEKYPDNADSYDDLIDGIFEYEFEEGMQLVCDGWDEVMLEDFLNRTKDDRIAIVDIQSDAVFDAATGCTW
ncbi:MAG: hypothetical protein RLY93_03035 [Sumerlaeia bacterium]